MLEHAWHMFENSTQTHRFMLLEFPSEEFEMYPGDNTGQTKFQVRFPLFLLELKTGA